MHKSGCVFITSVSSDGGMTAAQQAELKRVQRRSVRAITGAPKATSTAAVDAEMGIITLELATAIKAMQWWARVRAYPAKAPIRRTLAGLKARPQWPNASTEPIACSAELTVASVLTVDITGSERDQLELDAWAGHLFLALAAARYGAQGRYKSWPAIS